MALLTKNITIDACASVNWDKFEFPEVESEEEWKVSVTLGGGLIKKNVIASFYVSEHSGTNFDF